MGGAALIAAVVFVRVLRARVCDCVSVTVWVCGV